MKVLLTGGAGYIGSVTTELLLDAGHHVVVFDNLERGHRQAVDQRAIFIEGDLRNYDSILAAMKTEAPEAVMHFAAYALVDESADRPEAYFRNNILGGINLAEAMIRTGVQQIIYSSTCATYGQPERIPIMEDTPQHPLNPYGESKLALEKILNWYSIYKGFRAVFLRYFNAAGATDKYGEDHHPETHLIPLVLRTALGLSPAVTIYGSDYDTPDGTCIRDYVHVVDLARAHILALTGKCQGAFNLGSSQGYSVKEVISTAREVTSCEIQIQKGPRRKGDPPRLIAATDKARKELEWRPELTSLQAIIKSAWRWHQAHPQGYSSS